MNLTTQQGSTTVTVKKLLWTWQGYKIQYTVVGAGCPLVLVHGFGASIGHWHQNILVLASAGYRVFALDLLGFGGSDKASINYSGEVWVELLRDFWAAHIGEPSVFIGNSIGALLSLMVLAEHPDIAVGGVLINPTSRLSHYSLKLKSPLSMIMMAGFKKVLRSPITGKFVFNYIRRKAQIRRILYQVYRDREAVTDELVDLFYTPSCDPGAQQVFASILTAPPGPSTAELLPKVKSPLLVIWGTDDPWIPTTERKIYEEALENGKEIRIVHIPNVGHCPHDEVPNIVNAQIVDWLAQS